MVKLLNSEPHVWNWFGKPNDALANSEHNHFISLTEGHFREQGLDKNVDKSNLRIQKPKASVLWTKAALHGRGEMSEIKQQVKKSNK